MTEWTHVAYQASRVSERMSENGSWLFNGGSSEEKEGRGKRQQVVAPWWWPGWCLAAGMQVAGCPPKRTPGVTECFHVAWL